MPFDRHDWIVDRNGRQVRYVLDYYHFDNAEKLARLGIATTPNADGSTPSTIAIDVRPAIDSFEAFGDRVRAFIARKFRLTTSRVGGFSSPPDVLTAAHTRGLKVIQCLICFCLSHTHSHTRFERLKRHRNDCECVTTKSFVACRRSMRRACEISARNSNRNARPQWLLLLFAFTLSFL